MPSFLKCHCECQRQCAVIFRFRLSDYDIRQLGRYVVNT